MSSYLAVSSTDDMFMSKLIDWLNEAECEAGSTVIRTHENDPYEELDLRMSQIEGMTERICHLENQAALLRKLGNES